MIRTPDRWINSCFSPQDHRSASSSSISTHHLHHYSLSTPIYLLSGLPLERPIPAPFTFRTSNCSFWSYTCSPSSTSSTSTNMDLLLSPELISFHNVRMRVVALRTATLRWGESWIWFLRYAATTAAHLSVSVYFLSTKTIKFFPNFCNCSQRLSLDSPTNLSTSPTYPNLLGSVEVWRGQSNTFVVPESFCLR